MPLAATSSGSLFRLCKKLCRRLKYALLSKLFLGCGMPAKTFHPFVKFLLCWSHCKRFVSGWRTNLRSPLISEKETWIFEFFPASIWGSAVDIILKLSFGWFLECPVLDECQHSSRFWLFQSHSTTLCQNYRHLVCAGRMGVDWLRRGLWEAVNHVKRRTSFINHLLIVRLEMPCDDRSSIFE